MRRKKEQKLRLSPIRINKDLWYYEGEKGICVCKYVEKSGFLELYIPWKRLLESIKRKYNI